jgi:hypothetical protein
MDTKLLSRYELIPTLIEATSFEVVFVKKNGKERTMKCLFESTRYIEQGIMTVFDLVKEQYRSINFKTLSQIIVNDWVYQLTLKGKFMLVGNRKQQILDDIQEIVDRDISVLNNWNYDDLVDVYDELEQITISYDLEAVRALFEYAYEVGYIEFSMITDIIQGNLEFIPSSMREVVLMQLASINIPLPDYAQRYDIEYYYTEEDLLEYYFEASNGLIQIKEEV